MIPSAYPSAYPGYQITSPNPYYAYQIMATPVMTPSPQPVAPVQPVVTATAPPSSGTTQGPVNYPSSLYPAQYPVISRS